MRDLGSGFLSFILPILGGLLLIFGVVPLLVINQGYVLSWLWQWFIVGPFGVRPLSVPTAIGLTLVAEMVVGIRPKKTEDQNWQTSLTTALIVPWFIFLIGYLVSRFL